MATFDMSTARLGELCELVASVDRLGWTAGPLLCVMANAARHEIVERIGDDMTAQLLEHHRFMLQLDDDRANDTRSYDS